MFIRTPFGDIDVTHENDLATNGWVVLDFTENVIAGQEVTKLLLHCELQPVFQYATSDGVTHMGDGKRRQYVLDMMNTNISVESLNMARDFIVDMTTRMAQLNVITNHHTVDVLTALLSEKGCDEQSAEHTDYLDKNVAEVYARRRLKPLAAIFAVQEDTALNIRNRNGDWICVHLDIGELLVFEGDIAHKGCSYTERNERLHFYINVVGEERECGLNTYLLENLPKVQSAQLGECLYTQDKHTNNRVIYVVCELRGTKTVKVQRVLSDIFSSDGPVEWIKVDATKKCKRLSTFDGRVEDMMVFLWGEEIGINLLPSQCSFDQCEPEPMTYLPCYNPGEIERWLLDMGE
jgi:hypothetical protein